MNNHTDVPLLTAEDAETIAWAVDGFYAMSHPKGKQAPPLTIPKLNAIATRAVICKPAAAEEADRARIVELETDNSNVRSQYSRALTALRAVVETGRHCA